MLGKALVMQHPEPLHVLQHLKNSPSAMGVGQGQCPGLGG